MINSYVGLPSQLVRASKWYLLDANYISKFYKPSTSLLSFLVPKIVFMPSCLSREMDR
jgi:hypothetical protein